MIGYVSGETARGALIRAGQAFAFVMDVEKSMELEPSQLPVFFLHCSDVQTVECNSEADLKSKMEQAWKNDRALRLSMVAFDSMQRSSTRREAADVANEFLEDAKCRDYVSYHLYSRPFPLGTDLSEISNLLVSANAPTLENFFDVLSIRQESIRSCVAAWEAIPASVFKDDEQREDFRIRIIKTGAFYSFATKDAGDNEALFRILADPALAGKAAQTRQIVSHWASKYRETPRSKKFFDVDILGDTSNETSGDRDARADFNAFQQVKKQRENIKGALRNGDQERALELVEQLIDLQKKESSAEHLAKSLCDIATFAKSYGDLEMHYQLSLRATEEAPDDAWAFIQLGDAYVNRSDFQSAITAFDRANVLGDERAAVIGKAETLKYLGNMDLSLDLLRECIARYPLDIVAKNSFASVLAHFGEFAEALDVYTELVSSPFAESYTFGGRASVLSELNRFDDAIKDQNAAIYLSAGSAIPYIAKVDMLREHGLYQEAHAELDKIPASFVSLLHIKNAKARIYRDEGKYDLALDILNGIQAQYPKDASSRLASAEIARKTGRILDALKEYESVESDFPSSKFGRTSMAALYAQTGQIDKAFTYLSNHAPTTRGDWTGQHTRAMILAKLGEFNRAKLLLENGLENCPWRQQRPLFASALALLHIREKQFSVAINTLPEFERMDLPDVVALVSAIRMHAYACEFKKTEFDAELSKAVSTSNPVLREFVSEFELTRLESANDSLYFQSEAVFAKGWAAIVAIAA